MTLSLCRYLGNSALKCIGLVSRVNTIGSRKAYRQVTKHCYSTSCQPPLLYRTRIALPFDYENVFNFMNEEYYKQEPVIINMGLADQPPAISMQKIMCDLIKEGMTIIAETPDDCIIGAAVNNGCCPWDPEEYMEFARCCECGPVRDVIEFFAYVTCKPNLWECYDVTKIFECSTLAVCEKHQCQGIGRKLIEDSWYLARDCGYRLFRIDCTSSYTAKIVQNFGWECACTIPYREYTRNGKQVFKCIKEPHTEVQVFVDTLTMHHQFHLPYRSAKARK